MFKLESGVADRTRLVGNILMIILLAGNLFFSVQYIANINQQNSAKVDNLSTRIQIDRFLKEFVGIVLNTDTPVTQEDRVKLENDVIQLHDSDILAQWNLFVGSKNALEAQKNTVKLLGLLANKMLP